MAGQWPSVRSVRTVGNAPNRIWLWGKWVTWTGKKGWTLPPFTEVLNGK